MATPEIHWEGQNGIKKYGYWIHKIGTAFKDAPGNYIFAKEVSPNQWKPIYIGQTSSLSARLADHEKERAAIRNGATHIHVHTALGSEESRTSEEIDLIRRWNPVCNEVHVR